MNTPLAGNEPGLGDFEVVPMGGDSGRLIRFAQWLNGDGFANYEHARLYVGDGDIVEAMPGGARIAPLTPGDGGLWSTGYIPLTNDQRIEIAESARGYVGTPYSAMDYFAIAARRLKFGLLIPYLHGYVASSGHMICSQLVDQCYAISGVHLFNDGRWPGYVTPEDLATVIRIGRVRSRR